MNNVISRCQSVMDAAELYATAAHAAAGNKRRHTGDPYIVHPKAVVDELCLHWNHNGLHVTSAMISAAWLHDVVEDTKVTVEDLIVQFGQPIGGLVAELTKSQDKSKSKLVRTNIEAERLRSISPDAQNIKCCDIISNLRDFVIQGDDEQTQRYMHKVTKYLNCMVDADQNLRMFVSNLLIDTNRIICLNK